MPALQSNHDGQPLLLRLLVRRHEEAESGHIDAARLFQENMPTRLNRGGIVHGPKMRGRRQQNQVHVRLDHFFIGVEAHKPPLSGHVDPPSQLVVLQEVVQALLDPLGEQVAHGHEFHGA